MGSILNYATLFLTIMLGFLMVAPHSTIVNTSAIDKIQTFSSEVTNSSTNLNINTPILSTTLPFPNPFTLFSGFASMITSLASLPFSIFSSMTVLPDPLRIFLLAIFSLIFALAAVSWFKGQEQI